MGSHRWQACKIAPICLLPTARVLPSADERGNYPTMTQLPAHKVRNVGADVYGQARLELACFVKVALNQTGIVWFLDAGTLLGAYRNGKQIPHDDDFDTVAYFPVFQGEQDLIGLQQQIAPLLPAPYATRIVTSYAYKLEIYDPRSDRFMLPGPYYKGADFHTVTVDVQIMTNTPDGHAIYLHDMLEHVRVPGDVLTPTGDIICEGHTFNCPRQTTRFLEALYGYIGADARYDSQTKKYVKDSPG